MHRSRSSSSFSRQWLRSTPTPRRSLTLVLLVAGLAACVPSLQPLYTDQDDVFDDRLQGTFQEQEKGDGSTWTFERDAGGGVTLVYQEQISAGGLLKGGPGRFTVHPVVLGETLFLDLFPDETALDNDLNDLVNAHLLPVHTFWTAALDDGALTLRYFDPEWLDRQLAAGSVSIQHQTVADITVLTAPTPELRALMKRLATVPEAFSDPIVLRRTRAQ